MTISRFLPSSRACIARHRLAAGVALLLAATSLTAQITATWTGASSNIFDDGGNWTTGIAPGNSTGDIANFGPSSQTTVEFYFYNGSMNLDTLHVLAGAPSYTFDTQYDNNVYSNVLSFSGQGLINDSSVAQTLVLSGETLNFINNATIKNVTVDGAQYSSLGFYGNSTAGTGTLSNFASVGFHDQSSAANATISVSSYGYMVVEGSATLDAATVSLANGAQALFSGSGTGGNARLDLGDYSVVSVRSSTGSISFGSITGTGMILLYSGAALTVGGNNDSFTWSGEIFDIDHGASLIKTGTGTLTINGSNLYFGSTIINDGTLRIGDGGGIGFGSIINNATLEINRASDLTLENDISGTGALVKSGTGALFLNGAGTYTGPTIVNAGVLVDYYSYGISPTSALTIAAGAGIDTGSLTNVTIGPIAGAGDIVNGGSTMTVNESVDTTFSGIISGSGYGSPLVSLIKSGPGTLTLTGANAYTGGTLISDGILQLGDGGTTGSIGGGAITNNAALVLDRSDAFTFANAISGTGTLTKTGAGTVTLSGANTYTGGTTVSAGGIQFALPAALAGAFTVSPGALAAFNIGGSGEFTDTDISPLLTGSGFAAGAQLGLDTTNASGGFTYSSAIPNANGGANALGLVKLGANTLTLTGANSYTGGTTIAGGTLSLGSAGALGSAGTITFTGGTLQLTGANTADYSGRIANSTAAIALDTNGQNVTFAGALDTSNTGGLTKTGTGNLVLSGNNSYTGGTTVLGGLVEFSSLANFGPGLITLNGGGLRWATGSTADPSGLLNTIDNFIATFDTNGNDVTLASGLTGTGGLRKAGAGTLTLSGANNLALTTVLNSGNLALSGSTSSLTTSAFVSSTGSGVFSLGNGATALFTNSFSSGTNSQGLTVDGAGSRLTTGTLTLNGSGLTVTNGGTLAVTGFAAFGNGSNLTASVTGTNSLFAVAGNLTAANTSSGQLGIGSGGTVSVGGQLLLDSGISAGTLNLNSGGTLQVGGTDGIMRTSASTFNLGGGTLQVIGAALTTTVPATLSGTSTIDTNGLGASLSGILSGAGGALTKAGAGTLTLSGANIYTGGTTIAGGTLSLGSTGALGSAGTIAFTGGSLQFTAANTTDYSSRIANSTAAITFDTNSQNVTFAGALAASNTGGLTKIGAGTLTLNGSNAYTGATTVNAGTLTLGATAALSSASALAVASGATFDSSALTNLTVGELSGAGNISAGSGSLTTTQSTSTTFSGVLSGFGRLAMSGTGVLTVTGNNTFTAATFANAGTIVFSTLNNLGQGGNFQFNGGTLQWAPGNTTDLSTKNVLLNAGGGIVDTNGNNVTFANAIGNGFTGALTKAGAGTLTLNAANTYTGGTTVSTGSLLVNGSLAAGAVTVNAGATLGGSGSLGGLATFASGAHLAPGAALGLSSGTLTFGNGLTLGTGSVLDLQLGAVSDLINVAGGPLTGPGTVGGVTLNLSNAGGFHAGTYTLINYATASSVSQLGANSFALGTSLPGYTYSFATAGSTFQLTATAIPEPATYAALAGLGALGLAVCRKRRTV